MSDDRDQTSDAGVLSVAAWGGVGAGALLFLAGLYSFTAPEPPPLPLSFALIVIGFCGSLASFFAYRRHRLGWGFATSINGTLAAVFLFAAPRIRDQFEIDIALAALPTVALAIITVLLALSSQDIEP